MWEEFLKGEEKHVGKLASLLGGYEEEREAERIRAVRRELAETTTTPEEEVETESEDAGEEESEEEKRRSFERIIRERFIYGLLPVNNQINQIETELMSCTGGRLRRGRL